jgi:hypothetical protein
VLAVPSSARGKLVRCRGCGSNIRIPATRPLDSGSSAANTAGSSSSQQQQKPAA